jgi:hypothetical protein
MTDPRSGSSAAQGRSESSHHEVFGAAFDVK